MDVNEENKHTTDITEKIIYIFDKDRKTKRKLIHNGIIFSRFYINRFII
jgi:hypothetical protein